MVNEFDKQIDAMLRDLAKGDTFAQVLPAGHLDADEVSAFAENALPKKARLRMTKHLADCSKCRKILANTVSLSSENQSEIIHEEAKTITTLPVIPWYQKLFALPKLSYAMGGLALLLGGMIGLMVWQGFKEGNNSMVAQKPSKSANTASNQSGSPSLEGDFPASETYASNAVANAPSAMPTLAPNTASPASNSTVNDSAPTSSSDTSSSSALKATEEQSAVNDKTDDRDETPIVSKSAPITESPKKEEGVKPVATPTANEEAGISEKRDMPRQGDPSQNRADNIQNASPDSRNVSRQQVYAPPPSRTSPEQEKGAESAKKKSAENPISSAKDDSGETRRIGNKSFRKVGGVWTDTSYSGGSTKTVKRGSDEYKKLDSGLQNLGNAFNGTVIIVWSGKNYKIQ